MSALETARGFESLFYRQVKLYNLKEARLVGEMPGVYHRYDSRDVGDVMELVEQRKFRLDLNDDRAINFMSELGNDEFAGLHDGDFYDKAPAYVNTPYYQRLMRNDTVIMCGADWGEGGDWYYAFPAAPEAVYRVLENLIRSMPAEQFEQEVYDEMTKKNVQELLSMYRKQLKL